MTSAEQRTTQLVEEKTHHLDQIEKMIDEGREIEAARALGQTEHGVWFGERNAAGTTTGWPDEETYQRWQERHEQICERLGVEP